VLRSRAVIAILVGRLEDHYQVVLKRRAARDN